MRRKTETAKPADVLDYVGRRTGQRIRRLRKIDRDVMSVLRADLDAVDTQNTRSIRRRLGSACAVAVIGDDDELQARTRGGRGDLVERTRSVRARRVHMKRPACDRPRQRELLRNRGQRSWRKKQRRHRAEYCSRRDQGDACTFQPATSRGPLCVLDCHARGWNLS
jgi:hypothetical protein